MKKQLSFLLCIALLIVALTACTAPQNGTAIVDSHFSGRITEVRDSAYLLEVTDVGNQQFGIGNPVIVNVYETPVYAVGDTLTVTFDGIVAKSYPPQIMNATSIKKVG
jgi:hypothetical protein